MNGELSANNHAVRSPFIIYIIVLSGFVVAAKYYTLLNEIVTQLHLGVIHIFTDGMFFIFAAD